MVVLSTHLKQLKEQSIIVPFLESIRRPHEALINIHQTHGDLVLASFFGKKILCVCHPDYIEEIFIQEAKGLLNRDFLYEAKRSFFADSLFNSKADTWVKQRRIMQHLFTKEAVSQWQAIFKSEAETTRERLKATVPAEINLSYEIKRLVQRIVIKALMGRSADTIPNSEEMIRTVETISQNLLPQLVTQIISGGKLMWLMPIKKRRYEAAVAKLADFVSQEIVQKRGNLGHDLISQMMQATDSKSGYTMTQALLHDEAVNLFFAGQDTTINTLAWFFYLLGKHEDVHKQVTAEIIKFKDDALTPSNLEKLIVTKAALNETLRLYPPSGGITTQAVDDIFVGGYNIRKGTTIILSLYVTHRHAEFWERPNEFYPEHFLNSQANVGRSKYAFFPFGSGLHNCLGRHFAELEMMSVIVTLLREFAFKTDADINEAISVTLKPARDLVMSITPLCQIHQ
ncbi:cytochrome P450 [Methyloglobulus sp.]|uniref:cytochrome P450 n=1 Tax=Methyloglobulus sp. TaxID=2518622 RepID=UPI0032B7E10D